MATPAKRRALVVLSVPFLRVTRTLLNRVVLDAISDDADVLVVSPFSGDPAFRANFDHRGLTFLEWNAPSTANPIIRLLLSLAELLRVRGMWFRFRHSGLAFQWRVAGVEFEADGEDRQPPVVRRLLHRLAGWCGQWPAMWRLVENGVGPVLYRWPALTALSNGYQRVTLVQASSWGLQDRMLAWIARQEHWRTVLLPYTTDQLWVNGFLLSDYHAVCVQGDFESDCAKRFHHVPAERTVPLGSIWFRAIDAMIEDGLLDPPRPAGGGTRVLLYAGVASRYFPRVSELEAVRALWDACRSGRWGDVDFVYRPYASTAADRVDITSRCSEFEGMVVEWPEEVCTSLQSFSGAPTEPQLVAYLNRLRRADVVVLSQTTTFGWDAAYLGSGVVANFADSTGTMARRSSHLKLTNEGVLPCATTMPVAFSLEELVQQVGELFRVPQAMWLSRAWVFSEWDSVVPDLKGELRRCIFGEAG